MTTKPMVKPPVLKHYVRGIPGRNSYAGSYDRTIRASFTHTPVGVLGAPLDARNPDGDWTGTVGYFGNDPACAGLTDAVLGGPGDGAYNGVIVEVIDPASGLVPYASGVVNEVRPPFGDAAAFIAAMGNADSVNVNARSIEVSDGGNPNVDRGPLHQPQIDSYCHYIAWVHFGEAGQDPKDGFLYRCYHDESGSSHTGCPGPWFEKNADVTWNRIRDIGLAYVYGAPLDPPLIITYPPRYTGAHVPDPVEYWKGSTPVPTPKPTPAPTPKPADHFAAPQAVPEPQVFHTIKAVTPRKSASPKSAATGPELPVGAAVTIVRAIPSGTTKSVWLVDDRGQRYPLEAFVKTA